MPWNYWEEGTARRVPGHRDVIKTLEKVIAQLIPNSRARIISSSTWWKRRQAANAPMRSADRAAHDLMPGAGHMVHMPSHIYLRVGRYADASASNERAIVADEDYLSQCQAQGMYPVGYYPHNTHFLWFASTFEGRSAQAIEMARKTAEKVPHHVSAHAGSLHDLPIVPLYAYVRFGKWDGHPDHADAGADERLRDQAMYHYARGDGVPGARSGGSRQGGSGGVRRRSRSATWFKTTLKDSPLVGNLAIAQRVGARRDRRGNW